MTYEYQRRDPPIVKAVRFDGHNHAKVRWELYLYTSEFAPTPEGRTWLHIPKATKQRVHPGDWVVQDWASDGGSVFLVLPDEDFHREFVELEES